MHRNLGRRFDADFHKVALGADDLYDDAPVDDNVFVGFAGENKHWRICGWNQAAAARTGIGWSMERSSTLPGTHCLPTIVWRLITMGPLRFAKASPSRIVTTHKSSMSAGFRMSRKSRSCRLTRRRQF